MNILVTVLREKIYKYNRIAIYGCGAVAEDTYRALVECGKQPEFCVVTKKESTQDLFQNSIPVYELREKAKDIKKNNIFVMIGVSELYENEIVENLQNFQINHYLCISNFERTHIYQKYESMSVQEYLEEIAEWVVNRDNRIDMQRALRKLKDDIRGSRYENKIVFAIGALTPRLLKIAEVLQDRGYEIK